MIQNLIVRFLLVGLIGLSAFKSAYAAPTFVNFSGNLIQYENKSTSTGGFTSAMPINTAISGTLRFSADFSPSPFIFGSSPGLEVALGTGSPVSISLNLPSGPFVSVDTLNMPLIEGPARVQFRDNTGGLSILGNPANPTAADTLSARHQADTGYQGSDAFVSILANFLPDSVIAVHDPATNSTVTTLSALGFSFLGQDLIATGTGGFSYFESLDTGIASSSGLSDVSSLMSRAPKDGTIGFRGAFSVNHLVISDRAIDLRFSSVPSPGSMILVALGLVAVGISRSSKNNCRVFKTVE
jgi:hypothetical protein